MARNRESFNAWRQVQRRKRIEQGLCVDCSKPVNNKLKKCSVCKEKQKNYQSEYKKSRPNYFRELNFKSHLKQNYNLTLERYQELWKNQQGRCAITGCEVDFSNYHRRPEIDHDHSCCSGYKSCGNCIRALLCGSHNKALGDVKDSIEQLFGLIEYLQKFERVI